MNTLPEDIQDTIYKYKHQLEFEIIMNELTSSVYVYGACPKCNGNCEDEMPCWMDDLSQLQCDPEWVMTYGNVYKNSNCFKHSWYSMWRTGKYIKPEIDIGDYSWMDCNCDHDSCYSD